MKVAIFIGTLSNTSLIEPNNEKLLSSNNVRIVSNARRKALLVSSLSGTSQFLTVAHKLIETAGKTTARAMQTLGRCCVRHINHAYRRIG
jgi:hypothetical protein